MILNARQFLQRRSQRISEIVDNVHEREARLAAIRDMLDILEQHPDDADERIYREYVKLKEMASAAQYDYLLWARVGEYAEVV